MPSPAHRARQPRRRRLAGIVVAVLVGALATTAVAAEVVPEVLDRGHVPVAVAVDTGDGARTSDEPSVTLSPAATHHRVLTMARDSAVRFEKEPEPEVTELREKAEKKARKPAKPEPEPPAPISFRIASFNVLGSQHTVPGGPRDRFPPASARTPATAGLMAKHGVDVLGTQELQADQLRGLQGSTGMSAYPGFGWGEAETDNSILYDPGVFEFVDGSQFTITFMGRPRPQPILRLRHRATGQEIYVVNTHPSAGDGVYAAQRRAGQATLVNVVNDLKSTGLPVLVTGDMNDRQAFYCNVVPQAGLSASNGGSYSGGCQPPPEPVAVDWVVGSDVTWSAYWRDTTPVTQKTSDHFFISATAHVG